MDTFKECLLEEYKQLWKEGQIRLQIASRLVNYTILLIAGISAFLSREFFWNLGMKSSAKSAHIFNLGEDQTIILLALAIPFYFLALYQLRNSSRTTSIAKYMIEELNKKMKGLVTEKEKVKLSRTFRSLSPELQESIFNRYFMPFGWQAKAYTERKHSWSWPFSMLQGWAFLLNIIPMMLPVIAFLSLAGNSIYQYRAQIMIHRIFLGSIFYLSVMNIGLFIWVVYRSIKVRSKRMEVFLVSKDEG